jgi:hypothetical protein
MAGANPPIPITPAKLATLELQGLSSLASALAVLRFFSVAGAAVPSFGPPLA